MINAQVCTGLQVGDFGVVALGSKDPFGAGPKDTYNFFFVIGPGHANAADVNAAFFAAPETDTAPQAEGGGSSSRSSPPPLAIVALAAFALMLVLQRRRRGRTAPPSAR